MLHKVFYCDVPRNEQVFGRERRVGFQVQGQGFGFRFMGSWPGAFTLQDLRLPGIFM